MTGLCFRDVLQSQSAQRLNAQRTNAQRTNAPGAEIALVFDQQGLAVYAFRAVFIRPMRRTDSRMCARETLRRVASGAISRLVRGKTRKRMTLRVFFCMLRIGWMNRDDGCVSYLCGLWPCSERAPVVTVLGQLFVQANVLVRIISSPIPVATHLDVTHRDVLCVSALFNVALLASALRLGLFLF